MYRIMMRRNHYVIHVDASAPTASPGENHLAASFRRLITGHGSDGKSRLVEDVRIAEGPLGNFNFWATRPDRDPADLANADTPFPFFPGAGGTVFRIFQLPAGPPPVGAPEWTAIADEFFTGVGDPGCRVDSSRHPLMHTTPTTDYVVLLEGEVSLLLDRGDPIPLKRFDAVVQRATNHTWINTGTGPATLMAVMVGLPKTMTAR